jgi:hypothetical protein
MRPSRADSELHLHEIRHCRRVPVLTFIESPLFSRLVDDEYAELQTFLAMNPEAGRLVRGSGGVRKVRWSRAGTGKSGGLRVIYFARTHKGQIWLLTLYSKAAADSIPGHVLKALKEEMVDEAL